MAFAREEPVTIAPNLSLLLIMACFWVPPILVQIFAQGASQGVETLGPVQGKCRDLVLHFVEQTLIRHGAVLILLVPEPGG